MLSEVRHVSRARSSHSSDMSAALATGHDGSAQGRRTRSVAAFRSSATEHPPSMRARGLGVGDCCEEERPWLQLRSSTGSSSPSCVPPSLAAGVHPTAYSPRRRPLRASTDESRKSEHVTIRGPNAATRDIGSRGRAMRGQQVVPKRYAHHPARPCTINRTRPGAERRKLQYHESRASHEFMNSVTRFEYSARQICMTMNSKTSSYS